MIGLRPFWSYYGGKWRIAERYPRPAFDRIIEPFARTNALAEASA